MGVKIGTEAVGGFKIGTELVGGMKVGTEIIYRRSTVAPPTPENFSLYMVGEDNASLYRVSSAGQATLVGVLGITDPEGLAWDGTHLYTLGTRTIRGSDVQTLYRIDIASATTDRPVGTVTRIGERLGTASAFNRAEALAWDGSTLYAVVGAGDGDTLASINRTTGAGTVIGKLRGLVGFSNRDLDVHGMAWNGTSMYAVHEAGSSNSALGTVDLATGAFTRISSGIGAFENSPGNIVWDGTTMYYITTSNRTLGTISLTTGKSSSIRGAPGFFGVNEQSPSGLAWAPAFTPRTPQDSANLFALTDTASSSINELLTIDRTTAAFTRYENVFHLGPGLKGLAIAYNGTDIYMVGRQRATAGLP